MLTVIAFVSYHVSVQVSLLVSAPFAHQSLMCSHTYSIKKEQVKWEILGIKPQVVENIINYLLGCYPGPKYTFVSQLCA